MSDVILFGLSGFCIKTFNYRLLLYIVLCIRHKKIASFRKLFIFPFLHLKKNAFYIFECIKLVTRYVEKMSKRNGMENVFIDERSKTCEAHYFILFIFLVVLLSLL